MSLTEKNSYWTRVVVDIERKARQQSQKNRIKNYDYSVTLPEKLRKRVAKIMPYEFDEYDRNVFINEAEVDTMMPFSEYKDEEKASKEEKEVKTIFFDKSTWSEVQSLKQKYPYLINKPVGHQAKVKVKHNMYSSYICKPRRERVKWDSKTYNMERSIWEKTLDEQAEQLMDASAERFTEWLNSLSSDRNSDISKEQLKALFAIEGNHKLLSSKLNESKPVKVSAKTTTGNMNTPEMAIKLNYENDLKGIVKDMPKKVNTVAFGRTMTVKPTTWIPEETFRPITTVYPQELLTLEKLFKGITHLRSTKILAESYREQPDLAKPSYLVAAGLFKKEKEAHTSNEIPLYELLKLEY